MSIEEQLLHTPEGMRDIYDEECANRKTVSEKILAAMHQNGYVDVITPGIEFFDVFRKERGTVPGNEMFRFFDRDGNTLVLRPDITPSIARMVGKYYGDHAGVLRLCYEENTYVNYNGYQGKLKETTQIGIEQIGEDSIYADAEVVVTAIQAMLAAGLTEFQIEIGSAAFYRELMELTSLDDAEIAELRNLIEEKYSFGVETFLLEHREQVPEAVSGVIAALPECFGTMKQLMQMPVYQTITEDAVFEKVADAFRRLQKLLEVLALYDYQDYLTFDLGMPGKLGYYTGIILRGYTYGTGEAILSGGRYDHLMGQFGKDAPAVGLAVNLDILMSALMRQKKEIRTREMPEVIETSAAGLKEAVRQQLALQQSGKACVIHVIDPEVAS